jgi:hypothetical protein
LVTRTNYEAPLHAVFSNLQPYEGIYKSFQIESITK